MRDSNDYEGEGSDSSTDFDPYGFGGVSIPAGRAVIQGGLTAKIGENGEGDSDVDLAFNISVGVGVGN